MQSTFSRDRAEMLSTAGTRLLGACHIPGCNIIGHRKLHVQTLSSLLDFLVCEEKGWLHWWVLGGLLALELITHCLFFLIEKRGNTALLISHE